MICTEEYKAQGIVGDSIWLPLMVWVYTEKKQRTTVEFLVSLHPSNTLRTVDQKMIVTQVTEANWLLVGRKSKRLSWGYVINVAVGSLCQPANLGSNRESGGPLGEHLTKCLTPCGWLSLRWTQPREPAPSRGPLAQLERVPSFRVKRRPFYLLCP